MKHHPKSQFIEFKKRGVVRLTEARELIPAKALIKMLSEVALAKKVERNVDGSRDWAYETKFRLEAAKILLPKAVPDLKAIQVDLNTDATRALPYEVLAVAAKAAEQYLAEQSGVTVAELVEPHEVLELEAAKEPSGENS